MRGRAFTVVFWLLAVTVLAASPAAAQNVSVTADPAYLVAEGNPVFIAIRVLPGAPGGNATFRLEVWQEDGGPLVYSDPARAGEFGVSSGFTWPARPAGRYMIIAKVRFQGSPDQSASIRDYVVAGPRNPFALAVTPPNGTTAGSPITLEARLVEPGLSRPDGVGCWFDAIPATGSTVSAASPQCQPVTMRLTAGTWTLRLVVGRASPRTRPTLRDTLGTPEITGYVVTAPAATTPACPSGCEVRAGVCVKPRVALTFSCTTNIECGPGNVCRSGKCTGGDIEPAPACGPGGRCPAGTVCAGGTCRRPCP